MFRYTKLTLLREILTIAAAVVLLGPFYFLISTALKSDDALLTTSTLAPPAPPTLDSFIALLAPDSDASAQILRGLVSSLVITGGSIVALIVLGAPAAYFFARSTSRWSTRTFYVFLIAMLLPTQLGVLPLYIGAKNLGLLGSLWGMVVVYASTLMPLSVFIYSGFLRGIPKEYEESAALDGASKFRSFVSVVFPLVSPATGTVAILGGLIVWNDFFTALIFLNGSDYATLPVVMYNYVGSLISQWNLIFALVTFSMIPILALYAVAQKKFIQGYAGGLKA